MEIKEFKQKVSQVEQIVKKEVESAQNLEDLKNIKNTHLSRKSEFNSLLKLIGQLEPLDRKEAGSLANQLKRNLENIFDEKKTSLEDVTEANIDVTLPGKDFGQGHLHVTTQAIREIEEIFKKMGFYRRRYPLVEWDYYAFSALNFPDDHPARDEWETFFVDNEPKNEKYGKRLLTPHTSSGQVREMENHKPPIRMINIARTARRQSDVSHLMNFFQFEGLVIDKHITIAHLKGILDYFVKEFFGDDREVRIRPYHFRFTEPSFEVDVSVPKESKLGKHGWLEIGGAGMVHPNVLRAGEIDPEVYTGFAFGWGVERNKLSQKGINIEDIRIFYQNDIRFLNQF